MSEQKLISSLLHDYMNAILDNFDEGIYITDSEANTVYLNHSYELISGLSKSRMIGQNMQTLMDEGVISISGSLLVLESGKKVTLEQSFHTGKRAVITSLPIYDEQSGDGRIIMVVTVVRETTELYSIRRELHRKNQLIQSLRNELDELRRLQEGEVEVVAADAKMEQVLRLAGRVALTDSPVLISGNDGSGRSKVAKYIHNRSVRSDNPFMRIDFAALSGTDVGLYLFGGLDEKTGTFQMGIMESAIGGTVYIEEITETPPEIYGRILALLRYDSCVLGDGILHKLNIRIIAGSRYSLQEMRERKIGSAEIMGELSRFTITIPPLAQRVDDIIPLADYFLSNYNRRSGEKKKLTREACRKLLEYSWPEDVTELRNAVQRAAIISSGDRIEPKDLYLKEESGEPARVPKRTADVSLQLPVDLKDEIAKTEAAYMNRAFSQYGNVREAAESLGIDSSTFVRKRQKYQKQGRMD